MNPNSVGMTNASAPQSMLSMRMHLINPSARRQFLSARLEDESVSPGEVETAERWLNVAVRAKLTCWGDPRRSCTFYFGGSSASAVDIVLLKQQSPSLCNAS